MKLLVLIVVVLLCGCALHGHRIDFTRLQGADRLEVSTHSAEKVKTITDPKQIEIAIRFIQQYQAGWQDPLEGPHVPTYMLVFFRGPKGLGGFGIASNGITSHPPTDGFWSRDVPNDDMDLLVTQLQLKWPDQATLK